MRLGRDIADIGRLREILGILFEEGFAFIFDGTPLLKWVPFGKKLAKKEPKVPHEVRLRRTLERLGPTFIKFGQVLSVRPDLVPMRYIDELEKLQNKVPAFSFKEVQKTIERNDFSSMFTSIENKPIASASIAQVHKGVLKSGGIAAIKARRPGILKTMRTDIEIMRYIAGLLEKHVKTLHPYHPSAFIEEFAEWTSKELDFRKEADNIRRFYANFKDSTTTKIPKVFHSSEDIIIMEYLDGTPLHLARKMPVLNSALRNGVHSLLEQVFAHGLFHADPHPSNIIVQRDGRVGFVDFGIVGKFDKKLREQCIDLFIGIMEGDSEKTVEALLQFSSISEEKDIDRFREKIRDILPALSDIEIKEMKMSTILEEVFGVGLEYGIRFPREFVLFGKTVVTLEGIALLYAPRFKIGTVVQPFIEDMIVTRYEPQNVLRRSIESFMGMKKTVERLPSQATRVLDKLEKGKIKIEMRDTDIEKLSVEIDKSSNRLAYGVLIAALLLSGSMLINFGEKMAYGLPLLSAICFGIAAVLGIILVASILRVR